MAAKPLGVSRLPGLGLPYIRHPALARFFVTAMSLIIVAVADFLALNVSGPLRF